MNSKVIVFGGGGQLGVELCREFERRGWDVIQFDRAQLDIWIPVSEIKVGAGAR